MIPSLTDPQLDGLESQAEAKLYWALRISDDYRVFYSVGWVRRREGDETHDGSADFVICCPASEFVSLEVKGGGIGFDARAGEWYSMDRTSVRHAVKEPRGSGPTGQVLDSYKVARAPSLDEARDSTLALRSWRLLPRHRIARTGAGNNLKLFLARGASLCKRDNRDIDKDSGVRGTAATNWDGWRTMLGVNPSAAFRTKDHPARQPSTPMYSVTLPALSGCIQPPVATQIFARAAQ